MRAPHMKRLFWIIHNVVAHPLMVDVASDGRETSRVDRTEDVNGLRLQDSGTHVHPERPTRQPLSPLSETRGRRHSQGAGDRSVAATRRMGSTERAHMSKYAKGPERWLPVDPPAPWPKLDARAGITPTGCICGCSSNMGLTCPVCEPGPPCRPLPCTCGADVSGVPKRPDPHQDWKHGGHCLQRSNAGSGVKMFL